MSTTKNEVNEAQILASLIKRTGKTEVSGSAVQRSHRFPFFIFTQIENISKMSDVSISAIINQLLEVGLESVKLHLTDEEIKKINQISQEQQDRHLTNSKNNLKEK
ncbi:MAG TPA: hypothetical protein PL131_00375 [Methylotenera sp.]|nr:hypothetical protein [Methylotenera sp.]HPH04300.1 hypothetical protein [Methylotenera sp.]HPM99854.1 hypothetical protein [Methylotenera sp.]